MAPCCALNILPSSLFLVVHYAHLCCILFTSTCLVSVVFLSLFTTSLYWSATWSERTLGFLFFKGDNAQWWNRNNSLLVTHSRQHQINGRHWQKQPVSHSAHSSLLFMCVFEGLCRFREIVLSSFLERERRYEMIWRVYPDYPAALPRLRVILSGLDNLSNILA